MTTEFNDFQIAPRACLRCGAVHDGAVAVADQAPPEPGDMSICFDCGALMVYTEDGFRLPTDAEQDLAARDPNVRAARRAVMDSRMDSRFE